MYWNVFYTAIGLTQNTLIFPETGRGVFLVWFWFILTQCLPRCKAGHINIHHMPPNEVSGAWFSQQVVWFPGPSDNCLPHAVWKIPLFSGEIYEGGSVPFSSQQPLWSHSPLVDCLPNGHWQMGLKIASLAPLPQKPTVVGQHAAAFPSFNFPLLIFFFSKLHIHISSGLLLCFFYSLHLLSEWKLIKYTHLCVPNSKLALHRVKPL